MQLGTLLAQVGLGGLEPPGLTQIEVGEVVEDSRLVKRGDLFVARRGTRKDGAEYIASALERGAVAALASASYVSVDPRVMRVDDPGRMLGPLAQVRAGNPSKSLDVIAVTGTNGKTSVVSFCAQMLETLGRKCGNFGTIGYDTGKRVWPARETTPPAPLLASLLAEARDSGCTATALEASSHGLYQGRLRGISVKVAVFTNVTRDHLDYHENAQSYLLAKASLLDHLAPGGAVVLPLAGGDEIRLLERRARDIFARVFTFSPIINAHRLYGMHNAENVGAAAAALRALGIPDWQIDNAVTQLRPAPGRLELIPRHDGVPAPKVLVDYAHNPDGLARALDAVRRLSADRVIVVFGCGGDRDRGKRPLMGAVAAERADLIVLTTDNPRSEEASAIIAEIRAGIGADAAVEVIADRSEAIRHAISIARENEVVLIAGKGHEQVQVIGKERRRHDDREVAQEALALWNLNSVR